MAKERDYYEDGVKDAEHDTYNPPYLKGLLGTVFNQDWEREANYDYDRGHKAGSDD